MFLATTADGKQLLRGEKGKTAKTHPESTFGWALVGWVLWRSLSLFDRKKNTRCVSPEPKILTIADLFS